MGWLKRRQLKSQIQERALALEVAALEAITMTHNFIDPSDALQDPMTGELWDGLGSDIKGSVSRLIDTEQRLKEVRNAGRILALTNEFAINGHENRISYIVGTGHTYTVALKEASGDVNKGQDADVKAVQEIIDEFIKEAGWHARQQEIVRRKDRDGECFLRFFDNDGLVRIRFVEPGDVTTPKEFSRDPSKTWGIHTEPDDVEKVIGYLIDGEGEVPAEEVQHRKLGVDSNVKRGVPLFYPVQSNLDRAVKLLKNMSVVAQIQAAIAMIRKHSSTGNTVEDWSKNAADVQSTNQTTGKTTYYKRYAPGTILDGTKGIDYEFPSIGVDASNLVGVLQAELRSIASRLVMPEFMLTSDASNSNYASTMVAEGPAVKMFQRLQWDTIEDDLDVMDRVLDAAVANGRISEEARERVKIDVEPPRLENRERLEETQADEILVNGSAMSIATWQKRNDLDPDVETPLIDEDREKLDPFGGLDFGAGQPEQLPPGAGKPKEAE